MSKESAALKQRLIEESFGWLKDYTVSEVDGKRMMTLKGETVPFNVATVMEESEFVGKWLIQFTLGRANGRNYFNTQEWLDLSADGLQSVMIVDADNKPVLIIPPLVSNNLGPEQYRMFRHIEQAIKQISADAMRQADPMASARLAEMSENSLGSVKPRTVTDMVSTWYYEKKGIIPEVEQQIWFIRDQIWNEQISAEQLTKARPILYAAYRNEPVTNEDKEFINKLVKEQWDVDFGTGAAKTESKANQTPAADQEYDPLEC